MPINREFLYRTIRSTVPIEVTRGDVRRFAAAIGDTNPLSIDSDAAHAAGHRDIIAPPTFLITAGMEVIDAVVHDQELGLNYEMVVHGEQKFDLHRPVYAGDILGAEIYISDIRDAGRNELLQLVTEFRAGDELVATTTNTIISRGTAVAASA